VGIYTVRKVMAGSAIGLIRRKSVGTNLVYGVTLILLAIP